MAYGLKACSCHPLSINKLKLNPNAQKSYKISQKLSLKHATLGVVQLPYPIYSHAKAYLSKQLPWCAAGDPRLARGRARFRALAPGGMLCMLFFHPSLLPLADSFFCTFHTTPVQVLGLLYTTRLA